MNTELYAITADKLENAQKLETKYAKGKFPVYFDEADDTVKLLRQEWKLLKLGRMPGLLIIDKNGIIQYTYYSDSMADIPKNEVLFEAITKFPN